MDNGTCPQTTWTEETEPVTTWTEAGCLSIVAPTSTGTSTTPVTTTEAIMDDTVYLLDDSVATMDS